MAALGSPRVLAFRRKFSQPMGAYVFMNIKSIGFLATLAIAVAASSAALAQDTKFLKKTVPNAVETTSTRAVSSARYQDQRQLNCSTGADSVCLGNFQTLSGNQRLELQHVSCFIQTEGGVLKGAYGYYLLTSGPFLLPLGVTSQSTTGGFTYYVLQQPTSIYIPAGKSLRIVAGFGDVSVSNSGSCQIFGQMLTTQ